MTQTIKYATDFRRIRDYPPNSGDTSACEVGKFSDRESAFFLHFPTHGIAADNYIDSAYLVLKQIQGGYTGSITLEVSFRNDQDWSTITWTSQPANSGAGWAYPYLYAYTAGDRWVDITSLMRWLVLNSSTAHIIRVKRSSGGSLDGKQFSTTAGEHYYVVNHTAPPTAPTIGTAARVTDTQATIAWSGGTNETSHTIYRDTDLDGVFVQIASGIAAAATSYTDNTISANHIYRYKVGGANSQGYALSGISNTIYTTPAAPTIGTAVKTGASAVTVNWTDNSPGEEYFEVERRVDAGAWSSLSATIAAGSTSYNDASVPAGTVEYRVRSIRGALVPDWSGISNSIVTTCAPAAPTLTAWPAYSPTGSTIRVNWAHNSLDGSLQTKAYITYTIDGVESTHEYTGALAYYDIDIAGGTATEVVTVKVKTKGLHADYGPDSALQSTTLADVPDLAITVPAADEAVITDLPLVVEWETTDDYAQSYWMLRLWDANGVLLQSWTGSTEVEQSIAGTYLPDDSDYSVDLVVRTGSGMESALVVRTFSTDYEAPTVPTVGATFDPTTLAATITAQAGETGALPATDHLVLERIDSYDGVTDTTVLSDPFTDGSSLVDYVPRLDQTVTYRAKAVAANGAYSYADATVATTSGGTCVVNYGAGYASTALMKWNNSRGREYTDDGEIHTFAGRDDPVPYAGEHTFESIPSGAVILDAADQTAFRNLGKWKLTSVYREPNGFRRNVKVTRASYQGPGEAPGSIDATLDMTAVE